MSEVFLDSEAGDFLGQGESGTSASNPGTVTYKGDVNGIQTFLLGNWSFSFAAPPGQSLEPGTYEDAESPPQAAGVPALDISGSGRGCNTVGGRFIVDEINSIFASGFSVC